MQQQFRQMFEDWYRDLWTYAFTLTEDEHIAADMVQEVFYNLWKNRKKLDEIVNLKGYLQKAVRNTSFNWLKKEKTKHRYFDQLTDEYGCLYQKGGEQQMMENEGVVEIDKAINSLPDKYKTVIVLSRFKGLKNKEIAELLGLPLRTVETRIYRGLIMLKNKLSDYIFLLFNLCWRYKFVK